MLSCFIMNEKPTSKTVNLYYFQELIWIYEKQQGRIAVTNSQTK